MSKWTYAANLSGSENHRGYAIRDGDGTLVANVIPWDEDGIRGGEIAKLIVDSVNAALSQSAARIAELEGALKEASADVELMQEALERLKQPMVGPAIFTNICDAGRNEIALRCEIAERAQRDCKCWQRAEADYDAALAAGGEGGAS